MNNNFQKYLFVIFLVVTCKIIAQNNTQDLIKYFENHNGAFVLLDNSENKYFRINEERCSQRVLPASTFKIPNSIIGIETGVIKDENFVIEWDKIERGNKEWDKNNSLATAIKYSVVPYYQELARRVGKEKMQNYLNDFNYGNIKIGKRIDTFWLDNSLKISPDEQIEFLRKFYFYKLPASKRSINIVKNIMPFEEYPQSILNYKTGGGQKDNGNWIGWLVGYIEKKNEKLSGSKDVYFFALNVDGESFDEVSRLRMKAAKNIFKQLGLIE
jgi:beta-lactamase class D